MLYQDAGQYDNQWHKIPYLTDEETGLEEASDSYFQIIFKTYDKDEGVIQLVSRGVILDPNKSDTLKGISGAQIVINEDEIAEETRILCTYTTNVLNSAGGKKVDTIAYETVYANSAIALNGNSKIQMQEGVPLPAVATGMTEAYNYNFEKKSGQTSTISGNMHVPLITSDLDKKIAKFDVIQNGDLEEHSESLPRKYKTLKLPTKKYTSEDIKEETRGKGDFSTAYRGHNIVNKLIDGQNEKYYGNNWKKTIDKYDTALISEDRVYEEILVSPLTIKTSHLSIDTSLKGNGTINIVTDRFLLRNDMVIKGGGTVNIYANEVLFDAGVAEYGDIIIEDGSQVNFYVNDRFEIGGANRKEFNYSNQEVDAINKLNIFYYGSQPVKFGQINWFFKGTLVVNSANIELKSATGDVGGTAAEIRNPFVGNIFSGGGDIDIDLGIGSKENYVMDAYIYAPNSKVTVGKPGRVSPHVAPNIKLIGSVVCDQLEMSMNTSLTFNTIPYNRLPDQPKEFSDQLKDLFESSKFKKERWDIL